VPVVVVSNAVIHPRAMTATSARILSDTMTYILIGFCDAALASLAVFAPQRFPYHTIHAEMVLIE
jgi:hypothetical protein